MHTSGNDAPGNSILFSVFRLDLGRGALFAPEGEIRLRPKSFDVLRYLAQNRGRLVSRDELLTAIWGRAVVTEDSLTQCMVDIRRALGRDGSKIIRTVPRRGYIFDPPAAIAAGRGDAVAEQQAPAATPVRRKPRAGRLIAGGMLLAVVLAASWLSLPQRTARDGPASGGVADQEPRSIAVLPFVDMSAAHDQEYFGDGVAEEVLNLLTKSPALRVIARTSSFSFKGQPLDISVVAARLGVTHVLEGSVRKSGNHMRVTAQLVDARDSSHLWSETYDRDLTAENLFSIQSEIAAAITDVLQAKLVPGAKRAAAMPTRSFEAYDAYLFGRRHLAARDEAGFAEARRSFSRAIELDPDFALAYAGLADAFVLQSTRSPGEAAGYLAEAERAARKALELNPALGEVHTSLGLVGKFRGDPPEQYVPYLERAIELAPGSADARKWYAHYLLEAGRGDEGLAQLQSAAEYDPMSAIVRVNLGQALMDFGRSDEALAAVQRAFEIDPGFMPALWFAATYSDQSDRLIRYSLAYSSGTSDPVTMLFFVLAYLEIGDDGRAEQWVADLQRVGAGSVPDLVSNLNLNLYRGRQEEVLRSARALLHFETPSKPFASQVLLLHDLRRGDAAAARIRFEEKYATLMGANPLIGDNYPAAVDAAMLLQSLGEAEKADILFDRILAYFGTFPRTALREFGVLEARVYALQGEKEKALDVLRETIDAGWRERWWFFMEHDAAFDGLRADRRFQAMAEEIDADMRSQLARVRTLEQAGDIALPPESTLAGSPRAKR